MHGRALIQHSLRHPTPTAISTTYATLLHEYPSLHTPPRMLPGHLPSKGLGVWAMDAAPHAGHCVALQGDGAGPAGHLPHIMHVTTTSPPNTTMQAAQVHAPAPCSRPYLPKQPNHSHTAEGTVPHLLQTTALVSTGHIWLPATGHWGAQELAGGPPSLLLATANGEGLCLWLTPG